MILGSVFCGRDSLPGDTTGASVDIPDSDQAKALESPLWIVGGDQPHKELLSGVHFHFCSQAYIHFQKIFKKDSCNSCLFKSGKQDFSGTSTSTEGKKMAMSEPSLNAQLFGLIFFLHYIKSSLSTHCNYVFSPAI